MVNTTTAITAVAVVAGIGLVIYAGEQIFKQFSNLTGDLSKTTQQIASEAANFEGVIPLVYEHQQQLQQFEGIIPQLIQSQQQQNQQGQNWLSDIGNALQGVLSFFENIKLPSALPALPEPPPLIPL